LSTEYALRLFPLPLAMYPLYLLRRSSIQEFARRFLVSWQTVPPIEKKKKSHVRDSVTEPYLKFHHFYIQVVDYHIVFLQKVI
jgi:hypothetical protein